MRTPYTSYVQLVRSKVNNRVRRLLFKIHVDSHSQNSFVYCHSQCCVMSLGTANNFVLLPLKIWRNNILRIMMFSKYSRRVTPLYRNLVVLKKIDMC